MVKIRKAVKADVPAIEEMYWDFMEEDDNISSDMAKSIRKNTNILRIFKEFYVAEYANQIIGMLRFTQITDLKYKDLATSKKFKVSTGFICDGFVKKKYRRLGIMTAFYTKVEKDLKLNGYDYAYTPSSTPAAVKFLRNRDYAEVGVELKSDELQISLKNQVLFRKKL